MEEIHRPLRHPQRQAEEMAVLPISGRRMEWYYQVQIQRHFDPSISDGAGDYTREAKDGCSSFTASTGTWTVTEYNAFSAGAINDIGEFICNGGDPSTITSSSAASGGDGSITYQWKKNGVVLSSSNSATFDPSISDGAGDYTREAKDGTCASFTASTGTWRVTEYSAFSAGAINTTGEDICNGGDPTTITSSSAASGEMAVLPISGRRWSCIS